jgi:hypothetical protein
MIRLLPYWLAVIALMVFGSVVLASALGFWGVPTKPIDWTVSIALMSLFAPAFYFSRNHTPSVKSLIVCLMASLSGAFCFFLSDDIAFNQLFYSFAWLGAAGVCCYFRQWPMAIMSLLITVFGAVMVYKIGAEIPPGEYVLWVVVRNALFVSLLALPVAQVWKSYAPTQIKVSVEQSAGDSKKAA